MEAGAPAPLVALSSQKPTMVGATLDAAGVPTAGVVTITATTAVTTAAATKRRRRWEEVIVTERHS